MEKSETTQAYDIEYDTDYGDQVCDKEQVAKFGTMVTPAFYSVVIILSLVGNLLVLIILALYENLKSLTNIFILNMALSDLLFTASLPIWAVYDIWGWIFEEVTCKAITLIFYAGFYSSMLFLTIMTIHRYLAVVHPLSDLGTQKGCYGLVSSLTIWIVSFAAATPALIFTDVQLNPHTDMWHCEYKDVWWKEIGTYQQNLFFLSAFSVMVFCYVRILGKILKSRARMRNRTVKLIFSIVAVFFLGWTPYNVVIFLMKMSDYPDVPLYECEVSRSLDYAFYVCRLIAFSHCCLNPVFYAFLGVKFRNHLKVILSKVFHRQTSEVLQSRTVNVYSMGSMY